VTEIRDDASVGKVCTIGRGVNTGISAVINTAKVEAGRSRLTERPGFLRV